MMKRYRYNGKWIHIDLLGRSKSGKTNVYQVMTNDGEFLGDIKWYASWRRYAFYPEPDTIYERDCLRDIANFLAMITQERKEDKITERRDEMKKPITVYGWAIPNRQGGLEKFTAQMSIFWNKKVAEQTALERNINKDVIKVVVRVLSKESPNEQEK